MITVSNFTHAVTSDLLKKAPEVLRKDFDFVKENLDLYNEDDTIKKYIDTYISKLNQVAGKGEKKPEHKATQKKKTLRERLSRKQFIEYGTIGFDKLSQYKPETVKLAKEVMAEAIKYGYAKPFDFGRGKGKYTTTTKAGDLDFKIIFGNVYDKISLAEYVKKHPPVKKSPVKKKPEKKTEKATTVMTKTKTTTKVSVKQKRKKQTYEQVAEVSPEIRFIKRYVLMDDKVKTRKQLLAFINSLQRAIEKKQIRKTSRYAAEIKHIQNELIKIYNNQEVGESFKFSLDKSDKNVLEKYQKIAGSQKQRISVRLISRYVGIHGKIAVKEKAERLLKAIRNALNKKQIEPSDPYIKEIKAIKANLEQYLKAKEKKLQINTMDLKGLQGIAGAKTIKKKSLNPKA